MTIDYDNKNFRNEIEHKYKVSINKSNPEKVMLTKYKTYDSAMKDNMIKNIKMGRQFLFLSGS